jgi:hypothetical protein
MSNKHRLRAPAVRAVADTSEAASGGLAGSQSAQQLETDQDGKTANEEDSSDGAAMSAAENAISNMTVNVIGKCGLSMMLAPVVMQTPHCPRKHYLVYLLTKSSPSIIMCYQQLPFRLHQRQMGIYKTSKTWTMPWAAVAIAVRRTVQVVTRHCRRVSQ